MGFVFGEFYSKSAALRAPFLVVHASDGFFGIFFIFILDETKAYGGWIVCVCVGGVSGGVRWLGVPRRFRKKKIMKICERCSQETMMTVGEKEWWW